MWFWHNTSAAGHVRPRRCRRCVQPDDAHAHGVSSCVLRRDCTRLPGHWWPAWTLQRGSYPLHIVSPVSAHMIKFEHFLNKIIVAIDISKKWDEKKTSRPEFRPCSHTARTTPWTAACARGCPACAQASPLPSCVCVLLAATATCPPATTGTATTRRGRPWRAAGTRGELKGRRGDSCCGEWRVNGHAEAACTPPPPRPAALSHRSPVAPHPTAAAVPWRLHQGWGRR